MITLADIFLDIYRVEEQLKAFLLSEEHINQYIDNADSVILDKTNLLETLSNRKSQIETEKKKLFDLFMANAISAEEFKRSNDPIENEFQEIETEIPKLKYEIATLKQSYLKRNEASSDAKDVFSAYLSMEGEQKFSLCEELFESIVVGENDIEIKVHYVSTESPTLQKKLPPNPILLPSEMKTTKH